MIEYENGKIVNAEHMSMKQFIDVAKTLPTLKWMNERSCPAVIDYYTHAGIAGLDTMTYKDMQKADENVSKLARLTQDFMKESGMKDNDDFLAMYGCGEKAGKGIHTSPEQKAFAQMVCDAMDAEKCKDMMEKVKNISTDGMDDKNDPSDNLEK